MYARAARLALALALTACSGGATTSDATDSAATTAASSSTAAATTATTGASESTTASTGADTGGAIDYAAPGPHPVANDRFTLQSGERTLRVEVWYPADPSAAEAAAAGAPILDFVPDEPDRSVFADLLANLSPAGAIGTRLQTRSAFAAPPAPGGPWPLLVFSHCHECVRFSAFSVAEHLASHGFVVAAPDHAGNTLFDGLAGDHAALDDAFLQIRRADLGVVLDALLGDAPEVPAALHGILDPGRVGAFGHSFGAATVGRLAQEDPRVLAAMPIAAPVENPFFPGTMLASIQAPLFFVLAEEDNSIQIIGNNLIASNFKAANPPVWLLRVRDAGHWNFSDICGLTEAFAAGCGEGLRQAAPQDPFTYLDIDLAREIAGAYALAFFDRHLRGDEAADAYLGAATPMEWVTLESRL